MSTHEGFDGAEAIRAADQEIKDLERTGRWLTICLIILGGLGVIVPVEIIREEAIGLSGAWFRPGEIAAVGSLLWQMTQPSISLCSTMQRDQFLKLKYRARKGIPPQLVDAAVQVIPETIKPVFGLHIVKAVPQLDMRWLRWMMGILGVSMDLVSYELDALQTGCGMKLFKGAHDSTLVIGVRLYRRLKAATNVEWAALIRRELREYSRNSMDFSRKKVVESLVEITIVSSTLLILAMVMAGSNPISSFVLLLGLVTWRGGVSLLRLRIRRCESFVLDLKAEKEANFTGVMLTRLECQSSAARSNELARRINRLKSFYEKLLTRFQGSE